MLIVIFHAACVAFALNNPDDVVLLAPFVASGDGLSVAETIPGVYFTTSFLLTAGVIDASADPIMDGVVVVKMP